MFEKNTPQIESDQQSLSDLRHEHREELYDQIHERVQTVKEARQFVEGHKDLSAEEFEDVCEEWLRETLMTIPGLSVQDLQHVGELTPGYYELKSVTDDYNRYSTSENEDRWHKTEDGGVISNEDVLRVRRSHILAYDAMIKGFDMNKRLALELSRFVEHIVKKKKEVAALEKMYLADKNTFLEKTLLGAGDEQAEFAKKEVVFSGLNVNIILDDKEYNVIEKKTGQQRKTNGLHAVDTVINYIRRTDGQKETIQHEENHTVSECFVNKIRKPEFMLHAAALTVSLEDVLSDTAHPSKKEKQVQQKKKELRDYVRWYADRNTNELIADIDWLADGDVATFFNEFLKDRDNLQELIAIQKNKEITEILEKGLHEYDEQFADYMSRLSDLFFVAKRTGNTEDVKAAVILFKPSQIRHIERYTKDLCGSDEYELNARLRPLLCEGNYFQSVNKYNPRRTGVFLKEYTDEQMVYESLATRDATESFFNVDNVVQVDALLERTQLSLDEDERIKIKELLVTELPNRLDPMYILKSNEGQGGVAWIAILDQHLKNIGQTLDIALFEDFVDGQLTPAYAKMSFYGITQYSNVRSLQEAYEKWPMNREVLRQEYLMLLENGEVAMMCQGNERYTMEDYLGFLASLGYKEQEIQVSIATCEELLGESIERQKKAA